MSIVTLSSVASVARTLALALCLVPAGCGGKVSSDDDSVPPGDTGGTDSLLDGGALDAQPDDSVIGEDVPPGPRCTLSDGTPTCGVKGCAECALGAACATPVRRDDEILAFGACLPSATYGASCSSCDAAHPLCVSLGTFGQLTCVSSALCEEAARLGAGNVCYYTDKTYWKPGDTIPIVPCPGTSATDRLCGGACGSCAAGAVCVGRSPTHPVGFCAKPSVTSCSRGDASCGDGNRCLVFTVGGNGDQEIANNLGICMPNDRCRSIASTLPGGAICD